MTDCRDILDRKIPSVVLVSLLCVLVSCGHTREDARWNDHKSQLCSHQGCYRVGRLGPDWRFLRTERNSVLFFNESISGVMQGNATCRGDTEAATLQHLTEHMFIGYTERDTQLQALVPLAQREALHTVARAKLDGVPMVLDLYVLKRNGCVFDLSYSAPPELYERGRADFARFVHGFVDERHSS